MAEDALATHVEKFKDKTAETLTDDDIRALWQLYHEQRTIISRELRKTHPLDDMHDYRSHNSDMNKLAIEKVRATLVPYMTVSQMWAKFHSVIIGKGEKENKITTDVARLIKKTRRYRKIDDELIALLAKTLTGLRAGEVQEIEFTSETAAKQALKVFPKATATMGWSTTSFLAPKIIKKRILIIERK